MRCLKVCLLGLTIIAAYAPYAAGASLDLSFESFERILVKRVLTDGGRLYFEGDASETCRYSFIQEPRIDSVGERLRFTFLYAGRAGATVAGRCVGPGANFDLVISGVPSFEDGELYLADLSIDAVDTAYFKLVAPLIRGSLESRLRYPIKERMYYMAGFLTAAGNGTVAFDTFVVEAIEVKEDGLRMVGDFALSMAP